MFHGSRYRYDGSAGKVLPVQVQKCTPGCYNVFGRRVYFKEIIKYALTKGSGDVSSQTLYFFLTWLPNKIKWVRDVRVP